MTTFTPEQTANMRERWEESLEYDRRVKPAARAVLLTLARYADPETGEGICPSVSRVARGIGISRKHFGMQIRTALDLGWLQRIGKRDDGIIVYALAIPDERTVSGE